jgi:uroporphyrinogen decarboxylase
MKASMTPRERVLAALNHQPVDRIPIDLGGTQNSTVCTGAYDSLKAFLAVTVPTQEISKAFEIVKMDEAVLSQLPVDTRSLFAKPPTRSRTHWPDARTFVDDWGVTYRQPEHWPQWDAIAHPLAEATIDGLEKYDWPDVEDEGRYAGLRDQAQDLHENTDYAVTASTMDTVIFDRCWMQRGMEQFLVDMLLDPEFALALMEIVADIQFRRHERFLEQVGPYIDAIMIGDDMGIQDGLLIRPELYRQMVKPFHTRYVQLIKEQTQAKVIMHTCGSIADLVEDYIEIGVDVLNPMQVSANGMLPQSLKQRFGGRMAFWGGIDTQQLLPQGRPEDVRAAVRATIRVMGGLEGGYVLGAVHNVQDDVPPENVWAMLDEAANFAV